MLKKPFKYYAIRVGDMIIFRRTVSKLQKVRSLLYRPRTEFRLEQITYTGGNVVGCMPYSRWYELLKIRMGLNDCTKISREQFKSLDPYMQKERKVVRRVAHSI